MGSRRTPQRLLLRRRSLQQRTRRRQSHRRHSHRLEKEKEKQQNGAGMESQTRTTAHSNAVQRLAVHVVGVVAQIEKVETCVAIRRSQGPADQWTTLGASSRRKETSMKQKKKKQSNCCLEVLLATRTYSPRVSYWTFASRVNRSAHAWWTWRRLTFYRSSRQRAKRCTQ